MFVTLDLLAYKFRLNTHYIHNSATDTRPFASIIKYNKSFLFFSTIARVRVNRAIVIIWLYGRLILAANGASSSHNSVFSFNKKPHAVLCGSVYGLLSVLPFQFDAGVLNLLRVHYRF